MSGLVKGVKKAFKAIGDVVKKVFKSPIFKIVLGIAAVIFTGGAAAGMFGALGSGAGLGASISAGISAGVSALGTAVGAVTGGISSMLGMGSGAAGTAGAIGADAATSAAWSTGAGLGADTLGAVGAAETGAATLGAGAAEAGGAMGLADAAGGAVPFESGFTGTEALSGAQGAGAAPGGFNLMPNATPSLVNPTAAANGGADAATSGAWQSGAGVGQDTLGAVGANAPGGNSWASSIWNTIKPSTPEGYRMWGNLMLGAGQGIMQGRQMQDQRDWQSRMSAVPDITNSFQQKPGYRWALMGGK